MKKTKTQKKSIKKEVKSGRFSFQTVISKITLPVVLFLALVIRLIGVFKPDLIFDEGYTALAVQGILRTGLPYLPSDIIYPRGIAYSYLSAGVSWLVQDEVLAIRIVAVFFGVLCVLGAYLLAKELFKNKEVGLLAALVTAFSYHLIEISRYGRFYSQMLALFLFTAYFALKVFNSEDKVKKVWLRVLYVFGLIFVGALTIFSDSLGIGVLLPVGIIAFYDLKTALIDSKHFGSGVLGWLKSNWLSAIFIGLALGAAAYGQIYLERNSFYTVYRKLIDDVGSRSNVLNIPFSFSGIKFLSFVWALLKTYVLEVIGFFIIVAGLKFNIFKTLPQSKKAFWILSSSMFLFFLLVVSVAPQFQIRYFYIFYALGVILVAGLVNFLEEKLNWRGLLRLMAFAYFTYFLVMLPFVPLEKSPGSISEQQFLPSASLDYYPDSKKAFAYAVNDSKKKPYDHEKPAILVSTYRKELAYYGSEFNGLKVLVVPYDLETSLASLPIDIYFDYASDTRASVKVIIEEQGQLSLILGRDSDSRLTLIDPVTGYAVLRPEEVMELAEKSQNDVYLITSRFDYHDQYTSERYRKFLENSQDKVVYEARDEGYSSVYRYVVD